MKVRKITCFIRITDKTFLILKSVLLAVLTVTRGCGSIPGISLADGVRLTDQFVTKITFKSDGVAIFPLKTNQLPIHWS